MSPNTGELNYSGDELWSVAFSKVGCKYGKPIDEKEISKAIQAIVGSNIGNNATDTRHTVRSQLNMKKPSAQKQEDPAKTYDFVICDPQNDHYDSAYQDVMTLGTDNVVIYHQPYPSNSCGIPGRPARLVPGSSRPWRVNEQS